MKTWLQCFVLLAFLLFVLYTPQQWTIETIQQLSFDIASCRSGDLLFFLEHGTSFPWPGHLAIVVTLPQYHQVFVWDMPNPLFHGPDLLKPLQTYISNARKKRQARLFVQRLTGPSINLLPLIKYMSASTHFDVASGITHLNAVLRQCAMLPGLPTFLPSVGKKDLYYCTSAVFALLTKAGVMRPLIDWEGEHALCPASLLHPDFELNDHVNSPWKYGPPEEI